MGWTNLAVLKTSNFETLINLLKTKQNNYLYDNESKISFSDLAKKAKNLSKKIVNNYGQGNRFLIKADKKISFLESLLAIILSKNLAIPINPDFSNSKINYLIKKFDINGTFDNQIKQFSNNKNNDSGLALLTSGTTGEQKVVLLSEENVFNNINSVIESMDMNSTGNIGILLPLYHSFALITQLLLGLITSKNIYFNDSAKFSGELISFIRENKINTIAGVPTTFRILLMNENEKFPEIKHITIAGAALTVDFAKEIINFFENANIWVGYGLTEAGPRVTAINNKNKKFFLGSIGKPINDTKIKFNDLGELLVKSNALMEKYLDNPSETKNKFENGWLKSGDLGYKDDEGYLYIKGRKDDIFSSGGEKIAPLELERIIINHEFISNCAVFPEPDKLLGNKISLVLILKENISLFEIRKYCKKYLPSYLVPHNYYKTNSMPKTANGKLLRKELPECQKQKI